MPKVISRMMMVALLLSSCATTIKDHTFCGLVPSVDSNGVIHPAGGGANCDNFLTSHQQILSELEWQTMMSTWEQAGSVVECTVSDSVGDLKAEIEQLCSKTKCDYQTVQAIYAALDKMIAVKKSTLLMGPQ